MRVVAGVYGGRVLQVAAGDVRPTTELVRGAIFNRLWSRGAVEGATVVDLFAGTGALGIEALSRGAVHVTFVESDRRTVEVLRGNLATLGVGAEASVVVGDARRWAPDPEGYAVALIDPPYAFDGWDPLLAGLPAGLAVCESDRPVEAPPPWEIVDVHRYGGTVVSLLEARGAARP